MWRYEAQHCGHTALFAPVPAAVLTVVAIAVTGPSWHELIGVTLFPIVATLPVTRAVGDEPAGELWASLPASRQAAIARRLILCGTAVAAAAVLMSGALAMLGIPEAASVLACALCSSVLLIGAAASVGIPLHSTSAASSAVVGAWLAQLLVLSRFAEDSARAWASLVVGVLLISLALRAAGNPANLTDLRNSRKGMA